MSVKLLKQHNGSKANQQSEQAPLKESQSREQRHRRQKRQRRRAFPIWLRTLVVLFLVILFLIIGVIVGYGVIGDGAPLDALKRQTWQHVIDIMTKVE